MRLPLLLLLLLASCAPSGPAKPTTYAKGAYRPAPARAPVFSPTEDAPHTFEPGRFSPVQPGPRYAPVPHTPQTRAEPTIWATNKPPSTGGLPKIMGVPFPFPPGLSIDDMGIHLACAELMTKALAGVGGAKAFEDKLTEKQRTCMSAALYDICEQEVLSGNEDAKAHGAYDAVLFSRIKAAAGRTKAHREVACRGVIMPDESEAIARAAHAHLLELLKEFERAP